MNIVKIGICLVMEQHPIPNVVLSCWVKQSNTKYIN